MVKKISLALLFAFTIFVVILLKPLTEAARIGFSVVVNKKIELKRQNPQNNAVNILLLGIGGGNHDGPDLSDTIVFARIEPVKNIATLISLPRDLWVPELDNKINSAYATGQEKSKQGILLADAAVKKVLGQPIDYTVVVDFDGFVKVVDLLGGINVNVARTFTDNAYPIEGQENNVCGRPKEEIASLSAQIATGSATESDFFSCRYESIKFAAGPQNMNGSTALKFVRSRHAYGVEGSDFARAARQQLVINAIKAKAFSLGTILNPLKILSIYNTLRENVNTNIQTDEFDDFIKLAQKMKNAKIKSYVIDSGVSGRGGLLKNPPPSKEFNGAWVLTPRAGNGNFSEIQKYVACVINYNDCIVTEDAVGRADILSPSPTSKDELKK